MDKILKDVSMAHRIVVKVGTSTLTYDTGKLNLKRIDRMAMILSDLRNRGKEIILVSSGAIGVAVGKLGLSKKPEDTKGKQAAAAVGQCELMYLYDKMFSEYNNTVAQILLTKDDIDIPRRKRNTQNTINALLDMGIIPVVNENDTVAVDEIEIGDNDTLSAHVAELVDADLLVLFSDIDGLFSADPRKNRDARLLPIVYDIDSVRQSAGDAGTSMGTGGMVTKLDAAQIASEAGIHMIIANGADMDIMYDILEAKEIRGTLFVSKNFRNID
ncbi:MAG: glutamate 5-kinase [Clostridiales bacterium]|nr:glutamate 5-kinase [Clostridiales bacterium]